MFLQSIFKKSSLASMFLVGAVSLAIAGCDNTPDIKVSDAELFSQDWWKTATMKEVKSLVKQEVDFNRKDPKNNNLSIFTIAAGHTETPEIISLMLKNGANVNIRDDLGGTPLLGAALSNKSPKVIEILLKNGADINMKTGDGNNALHFAVMYNYRNIDIIKTLIKNGFDVNSKDNMGATTLMKAVAFNENTDVIELLIDKGADVNSVNDNGIDVLSTAAVQSNNPEIIHFLVNKGAKISSITNNKTPFKSILVFASMNKNPKVFEAIANYYFKSLNEKEQTTVCIGYEGGIMGRNNRGIEDRFINVSLSSYHTKIPSEIKETEVFKRFEQEIEFLNKHEKSNDSAIYPLLRDLNKYSPI